MKKTLCKNCQTEINRDAKKCPHCQSWQTKWGLDFQNPKSTIIYMLVLFFVVMPLFMLVISQIENHLEEGKQKTNVSFEVLKISESSLKTCDCGDSKCVYILGKIENGSDKLWDNVFFHVDFFDSNENLIDTFSEQDYDLLIPAKSDTTFRVGKMAIRDLSEYSKYTINIRWATQF